jgi:serine/threonine protein kinase
MHAHTQVLLQVVHGLDHLHALGYMHLNVKPSNVLMFSDGGVKLTDFGVLGNSSLCRSPLPPARVVTRSSPAPRLPPPMTVPELRHKLGVYYSQEWAATVVDPPRDTHGEVVLTPEAKARLVSV